MNEAPESVISAQLGAGEHLLWAGAPRRGILLRPSDAVLIPFSIMWGGFAIFWESGVVNSSAPFFFRLWGIPFVLVGLYFMIGRFFVDARLRASTYYGLTNQRVLIVSGLTSRSVKSVALSTLSEVAITERADRSGTIVFGPNSDPWGSSHFNWPGGKSAGAPAFEFIPEVRTVHERIRAAQLASAGARTA